MAVAVDRERVEHLVAAEPDEHSALLAAVGAGTDALLRVGIDRLTAPPTGGLDVLLEQPAGELYLGMSGGRSSRLGKVGGGRMVAEAVGHQPRWPPSIIMSPRIVACLGPIRFVDSWSSPALRGLAAEALWTPCPSTFTTGTCVDTIVFSPFQRKKDAVTTTRRATILTMTVTRTTISTECRTSGGQRTLE